MALAPVLDLTILVEVILVCLPPSKNVCTCSDMCIMGWEALMQKN